MSLTLFSSTIAAAQDIETLLMPGEVIEGHEEIEGDCVTCHKRFDRPAQRGLCLDCHEDVASDVTALEGFHGRHPDVQDVQCATCHTEHKGRAFDVVDLDEDSFDHAFTDFELTGAHIEVECEECHAADEKHRDAPGTCVDCHLEDDVHEATLGEDCAECHQPTEWIDADFDHDTTGYPLIGKHAETACLDCHEDPTYLNAPTDCYGCHAEDDAHDGRSGNQCDNCHNPTDWNDSRFDHARDTTFALEGKHASLACDDCHSDDPFSDQMETDCVSCHLEDDHHTGHNGVECDDCHSNDEWVEPTFDHDRDTDYQLLGGHLEAECNDCHVEPIFETPLVAECSSCHLEDEPHEGSLGTQCASCHTELNWNDPVFFDHDLTQFPLLGMHTENECTDCHETQVFADQVGECVGCHRDDDPHDGSFHEQCADCHNPVAWDLWLFDHDTQTQFPLAGAHVEVLCEDCHRSPLARMRGIDGSCRSCHRADDVHDGEYGYDCGRCHTAESFMEVRSLQ